MGDLLGSSPRKRASEDKARWKGPVLVCGASRQIRGVTVGIRADLSPVRCASEDAGLPLGGVDDPAEPSRSRGKIPPGAVAVERCVRLRATLV